ncbi:MAG: phosphatidylserine decarboxylase family protein [Planctomycetes bacterium]|nr:phosphatidylserine decarboxylase family protein [Planctomycetota bacterium]
MRVPLAEYGRLELGGAALGSAALAVGAWQLAPPLAAASLLPVAFTAWFFRDPERSIPAGPGLLVSPADGTVTEIAEVDEPEFIGGKAHKIGIFLSVFNCHVNRAPCAGRVGYVRYRPGKFLNAMNLESSSRNENNYIGLIDTDAGGLRVGVKQIAGLIARRIICACAVEDRLERGTRIGMIKFGSRTELYLPAGAGFRPEVRLGDKVRGGKSILGRVA